MKIVVFEPPAERLNLNGRYHWSKRHKLEQAWQFAAFAAARNAHIRNLDPCIVTVRFRVPHNRRRDPHNFVATVKPIIDGLVQAKVWPDDSSEWVAVTDPVFDVVPGKAELVTVELKEIT